MVDNGAKSNRALWKRRLRYLLLTGLHICALLLLSLSVFAAVVSRRIQPFYSWIEQTPIEQLGFAIQNMIVQQDRGWRQRLANVPLLDDELETLAYFVDEIQEARPNYMVLLKDGTQIYAKEAEPGDEYLQIVYHDSGNSENKHLEVPLDAVQLRKHLIHPPIELLPEDVRFLMEYPGFSYFFLPPYLIVTDVSYEKVRQAYDVLDQLRNEFFQKFRILVQQEKQKKLMYICLFKTEADYLRYAIQHQHPFLERSVGWYSQRKDCLFVFDGLGALARNRIDQQLESLQEHAIAAENEQQVPVILEAVSFERQRTYRLLEKMTLSSLRHESAHQLAFTHGVHSWWGHENLWIQEGMAQYCETVPIGLPVDEKMVILKQAYEEHRLIPWLEIIDLTDFSEYHDNMEVLYAQSWLLFYTLMQPAHQARFFAFLAHLQEMKQTQAGKLQSDLLIEFVEVPLINIVQQMMQFINTARPKVNETVKSGAE